MLIFLILMLVGCEELPVPSLPSLDQKPSTYKEDMRVSNELLMRAEKESL